MASILQELELLHDKDSNIDRQQLDSPEYILGKSTHRGPSKPQWFLFAWKIEIISWVAGLVLYAAIVVLLVKLNNKPPPEFQYNITPNAIIELLGTFAKSLLVGVVGSALGQIKWLRSLQRRPLDDFRVIDSASRGPFGSMLLLASRRGGLVAAFGAVIAIASLASGTFFQQTLRYDVKHDSSSNAFIPIAKYMNGTGWAPDGTNGGSNDGVNTELLSAPYLGAFSPPNSSFLVTTARCQSGNCTWTYETLGICNSCENVTSKLTNNSNTFTLPNGFGLNSSDLIPLVNITTSQSPNDNIGDGYFRNSVAFPQNGSRLLSVIAVGAAPGTVLAPSKSALGTSIATPVAFECLLQFCVRSMQAELSGGVFNESVISTWTDPNQKYAEDADVILRSPSGYEYVALGSAVDGTGYWLSSVLRGDAKLLNPSPETTPKCSSIISESFFRAMNSSPTGFPDLMENIANSLSLSLRTVSYQPPPVAGLSYTSSTIAVVTYEWLILPSLELAGSLLLLVAVMLQTRAKGMVPWTNSILASFFHGLNRRPTRESTHDMEESAKRLLVEFQADENGGQLAVCYPSHTT